MRLYLIFHLDSNKQHFFFYEFNQEDVTRPEIPRKEKMISTRRSFLVQFF